MVVVVDHRELAQPEMSGQRGGFTGDPLHEIAIAGKGPDPVVHNSMIGPVEVRRPEIARRWPFLPHSQSPAPTVRWWSPRREYVPARDDPVSRSPLPEVLDVFQREIVSAEIEQRVEQHRRVAAGQHESIAVGPLGVSRIVTEETGPQQVGGRRQSHGRAGMAGLRLLDRIHGKRADRVDAAPGQLGADIGFAIERG